MVPYGRQSEDGPSVVCIPDYSTYLHVSGLSVEASLLFLDSSAVLKGSLLSGFVKSRLDALLHKVRIYAGGVSVPLLGALVFHRFALEKLFTIPLVETVIIALF